MLPGPVQQVRHDLFAPHDADMTGHGQAGQATPLVATGQAHRGGFGNRCGHAGDAHVGDEGGIGIIGIE